MSASGANWLKRERRASIELPEQLLDALDITPGMTIADVGAGIGYFSWRLSKRVGPTGLVYATDIQKRMIALLNYELKKTNWFNIVGKAKIYFRPESLTELIEFLKLYKNR